MEMIGGDVMEGIYFYGFAWSIWIIVTFIIKKSSNIRLPLACAILLCLIISPYSFEMKGFTISDISILLLIIIFLKIGSASKKKKGYFLIATLIVSIGYVSFLLFELFDPIWIIFKREWMLSLLLTYFSVLLQKQISWRIATVIIGCLYGDILFAIIIHRFSFPYEIGSMEFLDVCALTSTMVFGWEGLKNFIAYIESLYHSVEREKQKTT